MLPTLRNTALAATAIVLSATPAFALDKIYSPHSEEGELEVEYNGSRTFDNDSAKNNAQEHELAVEYGFNQFLTGEASIIYGRDPGSDTKLDGFELEARGMFTQPGQYWLDSGILFAYGFSRIKDEPNTVETKLLLQKDMSKFSSTMNVGFEQTVGRNSRATGGPDYAFLWNNRYRLNEYFQPGIEIQSDLGQGQSLRHWGEQEHYIGPAVYGKLFGHLNYQAAWLAGASHSSADSAARLMLEYEMHF